MNFSQRESLRTDFRSKTHQKVFSWKKVYYQSFCRAHKLYYQNELLFWDTLISINFNFSQRQSLRTDFRRKTHQKVFSWKNFYHQSFCCAHKLYYQNELLFWDTLISTNLHFSLWCDLGSDFRNKTEQNVFSWKLVN